MLKKIVLRINGLTQKSKYIMYTGIISGMILLCSALLVSLRSGRSVEDIYLSCNMAKISATLFSEGIAGGIAYDFLVSVKE